MQRQPAKQSSTGDRVSEPLRVGAVRRNPCSNELLLDDPHVRLRRREEHTDAVEPHTIGNEPDHAAAHFAYFLCSIGD